ncbi:hypothetical protein BT69DRAFT_586495 [Atractiella rhizophila]|nr:hypothetical protein BT69DRAFT_586495 [Atractiella rhizophila]
MRHGMGSNSTPRSSEESISEIKRRIKESVRAKKEAKRRAAEVQGVEDVSIPSSAFRKEDLPLPSSISSIPMSTSTATNVKRRRAQTPAPSSSPSQPPLSPDTQLLNLEPPPLRLRGKHGAGQLEDVAEEDVVETQFLKDLGVFSQVEADAARDLMVGEETQRHWIEEAEQCNMNRKQTRDEEIETQHLRDLDVLSQVSGAEYDDSGYFENIPSCPPSPASNKIDEFDDPDDVPADGRDAPIETQFLANLDVLSQVDGPEQQQEESQLPWSPPRPSGIRRTSNWFGDAATGMEQLEKLVTPPKKRKKDMRLSSGKDMEEAVKHWKAIDIVADAVVEKRSQGSRQGKLDGFVKVARRGRKEEAELLRQLRGHGRSQSHKGASGQGKVDLEDVESTDDEDFSWRDVREKERVRSLNEKEKTRLKQVSLPWAKPQPPPISLSRERPSSHPPHALQTRGVSNTQRSPSPPTQAQSSPSPRRPPSNELAKVSNAHLTVLIYYWTGTRKNPYTPRLIFHNYLSRFRMIGRSIELRTKS